MEPKNWHKNETLLCDPFFTVKWLIKIDVDSNERSNHRGEAKVMGHRKVINSGNEWWKMKKGRKIDQQMYLIWLTKAKVTGIMQA